MGRGDRPHHRRRPAAVELWGQLENSRFAAAVTSARLHPLDHRHARTTMERAGCGMAHRRRADLIFAKWVEGIDRTIDVDRRLSSYGVSSRTAGSPQQ